jgi:hypothetical protein
MKLSDQLLKSISVAVTIGVTLSSCAVKKDQNPTPSENGTKTTVTNPDTSPDTHPELIPYDCPGCGMG